MPRKFKTRSGLLAAILLLCSSQACRFDVSDATNDPVSSVSERDALAAYEAAGSLLQPEQPSLSLQSKSELDSAYKTWSECSDMARAEGSISNKFSCNESFAARIKDALQRGASELKVANEKSYASLKSSTSALTGANTRVDRDLDGVWSTYGACQDGAWQREKLAEIASALKVCETILQAEFQRADVALKSLDVDPFDTF